MRMKSYNRLPRPILRFVAYLAALIAVAALVLPPVVKEVRGDFARAWRAIVGGRPPEPAELLAALLATLVLSAAALSLWDWSRFHDGAWRGERPSASRTHGNVRLLSAPGALKRAFSVWRKGRAPKPGFVVGGIGSARDRLLVDDPPHLLCIGGTGAGKTASFVALNTVELIQSSQNPCAVVLDPNGELYALTGAYAEKMGKKVVCVDFSNAATSDCWNPLQPALDCAKGANGRTRDEMPGELRVIADTLVPEQHEPAPIWPQAARILFCGIAAFVCESPAIPDRARNLSTVASLAAMEREDLAKITAKLDPASSARMQLDAVLNAPSETYGGFRMNLNTFLSIYSDPSVSGMLAKSDFSAEDFLEGGVVMYVRFSSSSQAYDALVASLVESLMGGLRRQAERRCGGTLPHPVFWILEEFGQLPKIKSLPRNLSVVRGQNMHVALVVQDRAQVTAKYGDDAFTVFNNIDTILFLASADKDTCKHYSEMLGSYTVEAKSRSRTKGSASYSSGTTQSCCESRLFRPEDLEKWDWHAGHLVIKKGQAYACSSTPVFASFAGDALGLGGKEPDAAALSRMMPERPAKNLEAASVWDWRGDRDEAISGIASAIDSSLDPRLL